MENLYAAGSFITAKEDPGRKLIINRYYKRIYYCYVADDPSHRLLPYFERELIPPEKPIK